MARINLKKIIQRDQKIANIFQQVVDLTGEVVSVQDQKGNFILGEAQNGNTDFLPIEFDGAVVGKVYGTKAIIPIVNLIEILINQEQEKKKLGKEVLDLYREVNLMYNFAQKLAETIDQKGIAKLTLEETNNLITADSGVVALFQDEINPIELTAQFGEKKISTDAFNDVDSFYNKVLKKEEAGILNDFQPKIGEKVSILFAPLVGKNKRVGMIILTNNQGYQFTAADLKFLSTLSVQSAAAIESAQLYEKNLKEVEEREQAIKVLHEAADRFVPNEFLKALGFEEITQVTLGDSVEKNVTVFFSDIRGYTALSEKMSPADTFKFIDAYNRRMGPIILRNRGFVNQYLGDGIMAIFPYSPADAIKASVEMQHEIHEYNKSRLQKNRPPVHIGIGLHTGPLVMGITGDEQRMDATTISDTVNTAARIEGLTKYYGVNILLTESCLAAYQNNGESHFAEKDQLRSLGKVQVKGKKQAVGIYECFGGDLPESIAFKTRFQPDFKRALEDFHQQKFVNTVATLSQIVTQNPNDRTACLFLSKANQLMMQGAEENWTGVEMMMVK